uniref:phytanoyl-CoA dioxygenase n=1 Tax=Acrobeloides nanus TaxID=290746 RepID=A0A914C0W0_9BILA
MSAEPYVENPPLDWQHDGHILSAEQKKFYFKNGYIVIKNCVPKYELEKYRQRFQDICEGKNVLRDMTVMKDVSIAKSEYIQGEKAVTKVQDFNRDPVLFDYCKYPAVVDVAKDLIGTPKSNLIAMHTMLINKPPDSGKLTSRHPMHQDLQFFPFRPADYICCAWTAMEWVHRGNGCLVVVPGSHRDPGRLLEHEYPKWEGGVNKAYYGIENYDPSMPRLHVEMQAGDTVFFHPLLIHGSGANRTDGFRKAISCHYANDDVCRYINIEGTMQEESSREIIEIAKKRLRKFGQADDVDLDFSDLWRVRARAVNGKRANL